MPLVPTQTLPSTTINIPSRNSKFNHPKSTVYTEAHSWCVHSRRLGKFIFLSSQWHTARFYYSKNGLYPSIHPSLPASEKMLTKRKASFHLVLLQRVIQGGIRQHIDFTAQVSMGISFKSLTEKKMWLSRFTDTVFKCKCLEEHMFSFLDEIDTHEWN